jgi:hypothetical protein
MLDMLDTSIVDAAAEFAPLPLTTNCCEPFSGEDDPDAVRSEALGLLLNISRGISAIARPISLALVTKDMAAAEIGSVG